MTYSFSRKATSLHRPVTVHARPAFTLIELLVAIGIFLILASLVLGAFSAVTDDRGSAAASSFRAWVEGAKSRAADLGRPVGIRPVVTADVVNAFGHGTAEFEYVASVEPLEGNLAYFEHLVWVNSSTGERFHQWRVGQLITLGLTNRVDAPDVVFWNDLDGDAGELDLLGPGLRIEIPRDSGNWYVIAPDDLVLTPGYNEFGPASSTDRRLGNYLTLVGGPTGEPFETGYPYLSSDAAGDGFSKDVSGVNVHRLPPTQLGFAPTAVGRTVFRLESRNILTSPQTPIAPQPRLTYRLELGVDVLEGERLLELPRGMVMDFDASNRMASYPGSHVAPFDGSANALMFSPTGEIVGDFQNQSSIGFFFCERDELLAARQDENHPANDVTNTATPTTYADWASDLVAGTAGIEPAVRAEPAGRPQIVTLLPKSGFVQKSEINFADTNNNRFANDPYFYQFEGRLDQ